MKKFVILILLLFLLFFVSCREKVAKFDTFCNDEIEMNKVYSIKIVNDTHVCVFEPDNVTIHDCTNESRFKWNICTRKIILSR